MAESSDQHGQHGPEQPQRKHEPETTSVRGALWFALGLFVSLVVIGGVVYGLEVMFGAMREHPPDVTIEPPPPEAGVDHWQNPPGDLAELLEDQRERLRTYAWTDREQGLVRVPIEQAMQVLARQMPERPLPQPTTQPATAPAPQAATAPAPAPAILEPATENEP